jgi:hypothetical protein
MGYMSVAGKHWNNVLQSGRLSAELNFVERLETTKICGRPSQTEGHCSNIWAVWRMHIATDKLPEVAKTGGRFIGLLC